MKFSTAQLFSLLPLLASAQRPTNTSICDYYTGALLNVSNATTQYTVLTLLVNTAVIGNWSANTFNVKVDGILNPGTFNGTRVNLLPYFDGTLKSSNRGDVATSVNFLDGGGAAPLKLAMAANDTTSNQYRLLTHLYQYFGALLGCSAYGQGGFPAYAGVTGMGSVHRFMNLGPIGNGYFISQVGAAAASFGVASADIQIVANALTQTFNYRCSAPAAVLPSAPVEPQAICQANACLLAANNTCAAYSAVVAPQYVNGTNFTTPTAAASSGSAGGAGASATSRAGGAAASATGSSDAMKLSALSGLGSAVVGLLGFMAL